MRKRNIFLSHLADVQETLIIQYNYALNSVLLPHANTQSPGGVIQCNQLLYMILSINQHLVCSCVRIIHGISSIFVEIMHLSQLFFHMLTLKALTCN